jgi:predicted nucleic acid-binding protein
MIILIDSSVLGQLCNPTLTSDLPELERWFEKNLTRSTVVSSMICDYEVRRGLVLAKQRGAIASGLPLLDDLHQLIDFLSIDEIVLNLAADIWAAARSSGQPTAGDRNLDADMIICATWQDLANRHQGQEVAIVTTNIRHLSLFANACRWEDLKT